VPCQGDGCNSLVSIKSNPFSKKKLPCLRMTIAVSIHTKKNRFNQKKKNEFIKVEDNKCKLKKENKK
jgi:hypothetical protein